MYDSRRKSNGRYRDASAILALCRLHWGRYRSVAQLASDMGVGEVTAREWLRWWRETFAVVTGRSSEGFLEVAEPGAMDMLRLRAWVESGHAFTGAEYMGERMDAGYVPWVDREWPEVPAPEVRAVFSYKAPARPVAPAPVRPAVEADDGDIDLFEGLG